MERCGNSYVMNSFIISRDFIVGKQGQLFELSSSEPFTVDARYESRNLFFRSLDRSTPVKEKKTKKKKRGKSEINSETKLETNSETNSKAKKKKVPEF